MATRTNNDDFSSAYGVCWDIASTRTTDLAALQYFRTLFPSDDHLEHLQLSKLHKIVFEVVRGDLQGELQISSTAEIQTVDIRGRIPVLGSSSRGS